MTDTSLGHEPELEHAHHPTDASYVQVAIVLAVLTAIEVALSYIKALEGLYLLVPLFIVMAIKFFIVASRFMHLRFDDKILTRLFYSGLFLAVGVYVAALATFELFGNGGG